MDRKELNQKLFRWIGKYRYVLVILAIGLILMSLPQKKTDQTSQSDPPGRETITMEERLEEILSRIRGAGRVEVLLTERSGESILYQADEDLSSNADSMSQRTDTVIISGTDRSEQGLIRQVNPPVYLGAVIVCQGGDNPTVQLAIVEAVSDATGLGADRITVLKMK